MGRDLLLLWAGGIGSLALLTASEHPRGFALRQWIAAVIGTLTWPISILLVLVMPDRSE